MDQPREKLRALGAGTLKDVELLAIFFRVGVKRKTAVALVEELLDYFGNLPRLLACTLEELTQIHGMGISKWPQIQAACELVKRSLEETLSQDCIFSFPGYVREPFKPNLGVYRMRFFYALTLTPVYT
jgi:DNA repair protein RadC